MWGGNIPGACNVCTHIGAGDFLLRLKVTDSRARLSEKGSGQVEELCGDWARKTGEEADQIWLEGLVHGMLSVQSRGFKDGS